MSDGLAKLFVLAMEYKYLHVVEFNPKWILSVYTIESPHSVPSSFKNISLNGEFRLSVTKRLKIGLIMSMST